jgi:hypothetical protein
MSQTKYVRQGDRLPPLQVIAFDQNERLDLTAFEEITFRMVSGATEVEGIATGTAEGLLEYEWADGDTDVIGTYDAVFVGIDAGGREQTIPTPDNLKVVIIARP